MDRIRKPGIFLAVALPLLAAGRASLPTDRGHGDVAELFNARGLALPGPDDAAAQLLLRELAGKPLGVADAVRLALTNHPALKSQYAALGVAAAEVYDAGRLSNPARSGSVMVPDAAGAANRLSFGLSQSFTDLLMLGARSRLAEGEFDRVKERVGASVLDTCRRYRERLLRIRRGDAGRGHARGHCHGRGGGHAGTAVL